MLIRVAVLCVRVGFAFSALTLYTLEQEPAGTQAPLLGPGFDYHLVTTLFSALCCAII